MADTIYFIEAGDAEPSKVFEHFAETEATRFGEIVRVSRLDKILPARGVSPRALVLNWNATTNPYFVTERLLKDQTLRGTQLVVYLTRADEDDLAFLKECFVHHLVHSTQNVVLDHTKLISAILNDANVTIRENRAHRWLRSFFQRLLANDLGDGEDGLRGATEQAVAAGDQTFCRASLLMARKKLDEAMALLIKLAGSERQQASAEPRVLHLMAIIAHRRRDLVEARRLFELASRRSPHHLERRMLLGQTCYELGDLDAALSHLRRLADDCPQYEGFQGPLVEIMIKKHGAAVDYSYIDKLLAAQPTRRLVAIGNRFEDLGLTAELQRILCRHIYDRADESFEKDDHFGAIVAYRYAKKFLPEGDVVARFEFYVRCAKALLATGNVAKARKCLETVQQDVSTVGGELAQRYEEVMREIVQSAA